MVGASVDSREKAEETVRALALRYPIGHSLPLEAIAEALGGFYEERRGILHATEMIVRPDGTVAVACYSSGPIGRLDVNDVVGAVRFWKGRA